MEFVCTKCGYVGPHRIHPPCGYEGCPVHSEAEYQKLEEELRQARLQISEMPKKILAAVNAEQLRCGKIAEAFWNEDDKLNADLRVKLTQAEKSMAYMISTNIRAMRWREENFTEKRKCVHGVEVGDGPCGLC